MKKSRAPKNSPRFVAALGFFEIKDFALAAPIVGESRVFTEEHHPQDRLMFPRGNLIALAENGNAIFAIDRIADRMFVRAEMDRWPKLQPGKFVARLQLVADMNGVLAVQE